MRLSRVRFSSHTLSMFMSSVLARKRSYACLGVYVLLVRLSIVSVRMHRLVSRHMLYMVSDVFIRKVLDLSFGADLLH